MGKEELKSMKQDGGKKSEKEARDWRGVGEDRGLYGVGPPANTPLPTQDWDLL